MDNDDDHQRRRERRQDFLREWQIGVLPLDEDARARDRGAVDFGQAGLKAAFLLNGGALVVFPALAAVFEKMDKNYLIVAALIFVVGLLSTWLATACAYFTMVYQGSSTRNLREANAQRLQSTYYPPKQGSKPASEKSPEDLEKDSRRGAIVSEVFRWSVIVLSILSFVAFVTGVFFGWGALDPTIIQILRDAFFSW